MPMDRKPFDLASARILISNDDGFDAPGIKVLEILARKFAAEVLVVAPSTEQSAVSRGLTIRRPLSIHKVSKHRYTVDGTPADSVMLGVREVMAECKPDLLLTGINRGANLCEDVLYSGTVAAAMEGTLAGVRSVSLSQVYTNGQKVKWETSEKWLETVLLEVLSFDWAPGVLMNVNFPDVAPDEVKGIEAVQHGQRLVEREIVTGTSPRDETYYWLGSGPKEAEVLANTDLGAVSNGAISVSPLSIDQTHVATLKKMKAGLL